MPPLKIVNETDHDGRTVAACVRHCFRELDLDGRDTVVKVKYHAGTHAYQGRFYSNAHASGSYVWDWRTHDWREIAPKIPSGYRSLIVARIGRDSIYPRETHVYDRRRAPDTWIVHDWKEALVSIVGHEAMHLKQYLTHPRGVRGRFNEVDTEWAAYRMWLRWRERPANRR